jgi:hypothetical protein
MGTYHYLFSKYNLCEFPSRRDLYATQMSANVLYLPLECLTQPADGVKHKKNQAACHYLFFLGNRPLHTLPLFSCLFKLREEHHPFLLFPVNLFLPIPGQAPQAVQCLMT